MLRKHKYRLAVLRQLRPYAKGKEKLFWLKLVCGIILLGTAILLPVLYSLFIEETILKGNTKMLSVVIIGYVVTQLVITGLAFVRNYCTYNLNNQISKTMRMDILARRLKMDFSEYSNINVGNEKMIIDDSVVQLLDFTGVQSVDHLINIGKTILLVVALFLMEWRLAIVMLVTIPVSYLVNEHNAKLSKKNREESWQNHVAWADWNYESGAAWREVRALNMEERCEEVFDGYCKRYQGYFKEYTRLWVTRRFIIPKIKDEFLMQFLLYFLGGIAIYYQYISIGTLLIFGQYYTQLTESLRAVVDADNDLEINSVAYDRALKAAECPIVEETEHVIPITNCDIEINHVTFRYEGGDADILQDFSLEIKQGERIGIVGESGRGKTTLLNLIVGLLKPTQGEVRFGGHALSELRIQDVHQKVGFVLQENNLFHASIRENMLYGNENATEEQIAAACKKAYISDFIESLPEKYDTIVGEKGIKLSGGQKQRIVLARLFLRDVDVFILDEATSALDQHAESMIQNAISSIGEDKTIIVVSHRENSLKLCQRLVFL